jgi:hypothetical protein
MVRGSAVQTAKALPKAVRRRHDREKKERAKSGRE